MVYIGMTLYRDGTGRISRELCINRLTHRETANLTNLTHGHFSSRRNVHTFVSPHTPSLLYFVENSEAWEANIQGWGMQPLVSLVFHNLPSSSFWRNKCTCIPEGGLSFVDKGNGKFYKRWLCIGPH